MKLIWSRTSELSLGEILKYIESKFGNRVSESYYFDVIRTVDDIAIHPEMFPIFLVSSEIRKAVIKKKTVLYYKIQDETIYLLAFYDVRMGIHKL